MQKPESLEKQLGTFKSAVEMKKTKTFIWLDVEYMILIF